MKPEPRLRLWAFALAAGVPIVGFFAPLGLAFLMVLMAVAAFFVVPSSRALLLEQPRVPLTLLLAVAGWGLLSALWAIDGVVSVVKAGQLAVLFSSGLIAIGAVRVLDQDMRWTAARILAVCVVGFLALFAFEWLFNAPISELYAPDSDLSYLFKRYGRATSVVALLFVPTLFVVAEWRGWRWAVALGAFGMVILLLMNNRTAFAAATGASIVALLAIRWPTATRFMAAIGLTAALLLSPLLPNLIPADPERLAAFRAEVVRHHVNSFFHRLRIWEFVVERIDDKPLLGWGLDSSRSLPGGHEASDAAGERLSLHPHNAALQIRVELGVPGLVLATALLLWTILVSGRDPARGPIILAVTTAATVIALMSYGLWQSWWVAALGFAAALTRMLGVPLRPSP